MKKNMFTLFVMASVLTVTACRNAEKKPNETFKVTENNVIVSVEEEKKTEEVVIKEEPKVQVVEIVPEVPKDKIVEKDSDGDKIPDRVDAEPKRALKDTLLAKGVQDLIILDNIKLGTDELSSSMLNLLDIVSEILQSDSSIKIKVIGHTCDLGTDKYNSALSEKRAKAAERYLLGRNTNMAQISVDWRGEKEPMAPNNSEKSRSKNRRVQIQFYQDKVK